MITLEERLADTASRLSSVAPPLVSEVLAGERARLAAEVDRRPRVSVGDALPPAVLADERGREHVLPGPGPAVIVFFRGGWCPYCTLTLASYQREVLPWAHAHGVRVIGVGPQRPEVSRSMIERNDITFPLLTDAGNGYARAIGLAVDLTEDVKRAYLAFGDDLTTINAGADWTLPTPTVVVTDNDGVIRLLDRRPDYTARTEPETIRAAIHEVGR